MEPQMGLKGGLLVLNQMREDTNLPPQKVTSIDQYLVLNGARNAKAPFENRFMLITPAVAKAILGRNRQPNRNVNRDHVMYLARLMRNGKFVCTHQGIAFDIYGNLLDGQHRLLAIIESGIAVTMMVSFGVPQWTMQVIDSQLIRTLIARLGFVGVSTTAKALTVSRILEYGIQGSIRKKVEDEEALLLLRKYAKPLGFIAKLGINTVSSAVVAKVAVASCLVENKKLLRRFVEVYKTGRPSNESETAALVLRRKVDDLKAVANKNRSEYSNYDVLIYRLTDAALYRFMKGNPVVKIIIPEKDYYTLPGKI